MKYSVDGALPQSAYLQLYTQIRNDITSGIYKIGDKLPSKRLLAAETGTSVITVEHAYAILCDEGYAEPRQRSGYFVIYRENDCFSVADSAQAVTADTLKHRSEGEDFPFSVFAKTMRKVLTAYGENILIKSPNCGCEQLRKAIASYLARSRGIVVDASQILIGSGAEYMYSLIVQMLGRESIYALESPSYDMIRKVYIANGASCDMLAMGTDGIKTSELEKTKASVLHITPFNSYPSGITATASKRREYIRWAKERDGYIIEDDFDSEFTVSTKSEDTVFSLEPEKTVIYMNTFSKTVAPSMRIGYMVFPKDFPEKIREKISFYSCTVPIFEQYVLAEFINSGDFERHINRIRRKRRQKDSKK